MQRKGDIQKRAEHGLEKEGLIHDPAEQHVAVTRIVQIGSEQMRDIGQHHPFVFFRNAEDFRIFFKKFFEQQNTPVRKARTGV